MMYVAGMQQLTFGNSCNGKNLTIEFECGVILPKMCAE